ncbi:MAG TPA: CDGSH iron-sulfur domain-containing protein [Bacteroidales bacterium]|nr:CDGSH iron-sulfur domain-containing protein [Bacteroidales bacterium]
MENQSEKQKVQVEVIENGPLRITGHFILRDLKRDFEDKPDVIELCRCGKSNNKPYCDGSHLKP